MASRKTIWIGISAVHNDVLLVGGDSRKITSLVQTITQVGTTTLLFMSLSSIGVAFLATVVAVVSGGIIIIIIIGVPCSNLLLFFIILLILLAARVIKIVVLDVPQSPLKDCPALF